MQVQAYQKGPAMSVPPRIEPECTAESIDLAIAQNQSDRAHVASQLARIDGQFALRLLVNTWGAQTIASWLWNLAAQAEQPVAFPSQDDRR